VTPGILKAGRGPERPVHAPNAALLIDFDNVTLGIRSDLTKELRTLLNSDIIKGKVAVQRAYADWRRYPQYIVPLSESSIDLIFAPAFGTAKKNATDIRLAIDAIELVFTRPEIGTVILLSGDSDFSSLVIKLKEYGKYVIGVGIRESASDLLIQNCDEYYSYSDLAGLTREVDTPSIQRDPWELVVEAVQRMAQHADVMRSDRLKQVMQQIDQNFDEKNAGFNRFSKFVQEAANRGLVAVSKLENGQFEVAPVAGRALGRAEAAPAREAERGRGRGRGRPPREAPAAVPAPAPLPVEAAVEAAGENGERRGRRRGRGRGRGVREDTGAPAASRASEALAGLTLARAFELMGDALAELPSPAAHETLRLRMVALHGRDDELLQPHRFPRLLRQAHDAEVADVHKVGDDEYEVASHAFQGGFRVEPGTRAEPAAAVASEGSAAPAPAAGAPAAVAPEPAGGRAMLRFRRGSAGPGAKSPAALQMVGVVKVAMPEPAAAPVMAEAPAGAAPKPRGRRPGARPAEPKPAAAEPKKARVAKKAAKPAAAKRAKKAASTTKE
jgi:uncharacterized protein (TIGR00288 family)